MHMNIRNEYLRLLLVIGMYLSCLAIALCIFQIPVELKLRGTIPTRILIMLSVAFLILFLTVLTSNEPSWKTSIKISGYTAALVMLGVGLYGTKQFLYYLLGHTVYLDMFYSLSMAIGGISVALLIGKGINSKWLN